MIDRALRLPEDHNAEDVVVRTPESRRAAKIRVESTFNIGYLIFALAVLGAIASALLQPDKNWAMPSCVVTAAGDIAACDN